MSIGAAGYFEVTTEQCTRLDQSSVAKACAAHVFGEGEDLEHAERCLLERALELTARAPIYQSFRKVRIPKMQKFICLGSSWG